MRTIVFTLTAVLFTACGSPAPKVEPRPARPAVRAFCMHARTASGARVVACADNLKTCQWLASSALRYGDRVGIVGVVRCYEATP